MSEEIFTEDELVYKFKPVSTGSIHFKVRAANDAHIALTSGPEATNPMIEVFIGGWSNEKSVIRLNQTKPDVVEQATPGILSGSEFRGFWITWDNGKISAGKEGEPVPFIEWTNPDPFGIGYYGICTGWGASGTWIVEGSSNELSTIDGGDCLSYNFYPIRQGSIEVDVRAASNAHITLTTAAKEVDPRYEIIIGGWDNTGSLIRKYGDPEPDKIKVETKNLLSSGEYKTFLLEWEDGHIRVQHSGKVLVDWRDPAPIGISHYGFRTAYGATGNWRIKSADLRRTRRATTQPGWNIPASTPTGSGDWVDASAGEVPPGAVPGGFDGEQLYIARARHEGALLPGKLVPSHGVTYVPWGGAENGVDTYQVLCNCSPTWVASKDGEVPPGALPGGEAEDGEPLFIGRANVNGVISLGKVQPSHKVCYVPYGGTESAQPDYEVLVSN